MPLPLMISLAYYQRCESHEQRFHFGSEQRPAGQLRYNRACSLPSFATDGSTAIDSSGPGVVGAMVIEGKGGELFELEDLVGVFVPDAG